MKTLGSAILALVVLVALLHAAAAQTILTNGLLTATLSSTGGLITVSQSFGNDTKTFGLQTKLMTEMDKSSAVNSVSTFLSETFIVNDPTDETFQGVAVHSASLFLDLPLDGTSGNSSSVLGLTIKVSVFNEAGTVKIGGTQYPVDTGKMAITYTIRDWPFDSYDNTLNLRTGVQTPGAGGSIANRELFLFNGASWTFASTATIPAPYDSSPVTVKSSNTDSGVDVTMQFYASGSISYDTLWSVETATSDATRLTSFLAAYF